jgi:hypothetical protein
MPARVQLSLLLRKCVPGCHHKTGIVLDQADGQTVLQVMERLNIPAEKFSNITIMVNSYPGKPRSVVAEADGITLTKVIGGARTAHAVDVNTRRYLWT